MFACSLQFSKQQHETQRIRNDAAHDDACHDDDDDDDDVTLNTLLLLLLLLPNKRVKLAAGSDVNVMLIDLHCRQDLV